MHIKYSCQSGTKQKKLRKIKLEKFKMKIKSCRQQEQEYKSKNIEKQNQKFQTSTTKNQKLEMKNQSTKSKFVGSLLDMSLNQCLVLAVKSLSLLQ